MHLNRESSEKSSMNSRRTEYPSCRGPRLLLLYLGLAAIITVTGCARKPWRQPIAADDRSAVLQVIDEIRQTESQRSTCFDTDVNIFFTSHVKNRAISGYMLLMQPASVKFISSNPLGQPLFAFVSDRRHFQYVNTFEQLFVDGEVAAFADLYDIPPVAYSAPWGKWLTGRLPATASVTAIRRDASHHGVWVTVADERATEQREQTAAGLEHLLIDMDNKLLLGRIFTDHDGAIAARISYDNWLDSTSGLLSRQPGRITVTELDYGGELVLEFSNLQPLDFCSVKDFYLRRPPNYRYEPLPSNKH